MTQSPSIVIEDLSRWYGEVLGINRVSIEIRPGTTGLVGPNGSGKSTLMNIICGLLRPSYGRIAVLGQSCWNNPALRRRIGYCTQVDHFFENFTGRQFMQSLLALHGRGRAWTRRAAVEGLERVNLREAADRKIRGYSKGMRQRVKIALALAHEPQILVLDEPFNGLDPMGRHEMMKLFAEYSRAGRTILLSSHILHEIEQMTDNILMMSNGYVLAEGQIREVRDQLTRHPFQIFVRCDRPRELAALMLREDNVVHVQVEDERAVTLATLNPDAFYLRFNELVLEHRFDVDVITLADENVQSIYHYLSGREHH